MPKYTQCTSLGELVRRSHLIDIDARSKLLKAKSKRQEDIDYFMTGEKEASEKKSKRQRKRQDSNQSNLLAMFMDKMGPKKRTNNDDDRLNSPEGSLSGSQRLRQMTSLVKQDTKDLPDEKLLERRKRRQRARSVSDGVAAMRLFSSTSLPAEEALKSDSTSMELEGKLQAFTPRQAGKRRPRQRMMSTGVLQMQSEKLDSFFNGDHGDKNSEIFDKWLRSKDTEKRKTNFSAKQSGLKPVEEILKDNVHDQLDNEDEISIHSSIHSEDSVEIRVVTVEAEENLLHNVPISERLRTFISLDRYPLLSAIFGSMFVLFLLSVRVEIILLDTCALKDNLNTWNFVPSRIAAFWLIVTWLISFLIESSITLFLFGRKGKNFQPVFVIAAAFDLILTCICLGIFLWAESQRCCQCYERRSIIFMADLPKEDGICEVPYPSKCCPSFGSRLCNGVGKLEPFASLIAVRIIRFSMARIFVRSSTNIKKYLSKEHNNNEQIIDEVVPGESDMENHRKDDIDFDHRTGTIAELWVLALEKYPDIAKEHGIFSGLLLETMLGIEKLPFDQNALAKSDSKNVSTLSFKERRLERAISALSVRSAGGSSIGFDLNTHNDNNFLRPAAHLIRSMRRCECKWQWLKSRGDLSWEVVDVVMTEFEIVWFDATASSTYWDEAENNRIQIVKGDMKKGGKGLHLSDVSSGREVLGRLALTDIDHISIQRIMPSTEVPHSTDPTLDLEATNQQYIFKEYWKDYDDSCNLTLPLDKHWEDITEDRLILHSSQGTLSLRFFVDLYDVVEPASSGETIEKKQGALLWCESISHLCGKSQLKQKLPHFGENRNDELNDFIEVITRNRRGT